MERQEEDRKKEEPKLLSDQISVELDTDQRTPPGAWSELMAMNVFYELKASRERQKWGNDCEEEYKEDWTQTTVVCQTIVVNDLAIELQPCDDQSFKHGLVKRWLEASRIQWIFSSVKSLYVY